MSLSSDVPLSQTRPPGTTVYEAAGGQDFFDRLVDRFYAGVAADPVLLRLYPDQENLGPAKRRLALFLGQYWGGPTTYSDERGHPRLRMRHLPFDIGAVERAHWMAAMTAALDDLEPPRALRERFDQHFATAAEAMINQPT